MHPRTAVGLIGEACAFSKLTAADCLNAHLLLACSCAKARNWSWSRSECEGRTDSNQFSVCRSWRCEQVCKFVVSWKGMREKKVLTTFEE